MTGKPTDDLELAALIASKICHDIVGPVGAIYNGIEVLDEGGDEKSRDYALDIIRSSTETASSKLKFARFAFGAAGSAGATIDLGTAREISEGYVGAGKHTISWQAPGGHMAKDQVKLLLNLVAVAVTALPRGGEIAVSISGSLQQPGFEIRCKGNGARLPQHLPEMLANPSAASPDSMTIQAYYVWRLTKASGMPLDVRMDGAEVVISARSG